MLVRLRAVDGDLLQAVRSASAHRAVGATRICLTFESPLVMLFACGLLR